MKKRTLRFKLIAGGCCIVLVPLMILGILIENRAANALEETARNQMQAAARANAQMVEMALSSELKMAGQIASGQNIAAATATAIQNSLAEADISSLGAVLSAIREKRGADYDAIVVTDKDGNVIADSQNSAYKGTSLGNSAGFSDAAAGKPAMGGVVKSKTSGYPVLAVLAPVISSDGTTVGILNVYLSLNSLNQAVTTKIGETGYGYAVDRSGLLVLHPDKNKVLTTNLFALNGMEEIAKGMKTRQSGVEKYVFAGSRK
jgi:methyl-accepting chemotaxis protein